MNAKQVMLSTAPCVVIGSMHAWNPRLEPERRRIHLGLG
jgi:hypothetical protein